MVFASLLLLTALQVPEAVLIPPPTAPQLLLGGSFDAGPFRFHLTNARCVAYRQDRFDSPLYSIRVSAATGMVAHCLQTACGHRASRIVLAGTVTNVLIHAEVTTSQAVASASEGGRPTARACSRTAAISVGV